MAWRPSAYWRALSRSLHVAAVAVVVLKYAWPAIASHDQALQMIDAPGVTVHGQCCVEAPDHYFGRIAFLLAGLLSVLGVFANALAERMARAAIEPPRPRA